MIDEGEDAGQRVNFLQLQFSRIAAAIAKLVVLADDRENFIRQAGLASCIDAPLAVLLIQGLFCPVERVGFKQDAVRDFCLTGIMEKRGGTEGADLFGWQAQLFGQHQGEHGDVERMEIDILAADPVIHQVDGDVLVGHQRIQHLADDLATGFRRFFRARENGAVEPFGDVDGGKKILFAGSNGGTTVFKTRNPLAFCRQQRLILFGDLRFWFHFRHERGQLTVAR